MNNMNGIFSFLNVFNKNSITTTQSYWPNPKYSGLILLVCSGLVAWRQQFGTAIDCLARDDIPTRHINDYCYIHSTYSFEESWNKSVGVDILYPGIDKYSPESTKVYHSYYQWVSLLLFVQSVMFSIPVGFWKCMEGGKLRKLVSIGRVFTSHEEAQKNNTEELVQGFLASSRSNRRYFFNYCLASVLNIANVIGQIALMDSFLGGGFFSYGFKIVEFSWHRIPQPDPRDVVFPKMAQCDYYNYGRTGDVQRHDFLCLLPINILNEKIYIFLWFWFFVLGVLSALVVLIDFSFMFSPSLRFKMLSSGLHFSDQCVAEKVMDGCHCGHWFLIVLLRRNIHPKSFRDFMVGLSAEWSRNVRDVSRLPLEERKHLYKLDKDVEEGPPIIPPKPRRNIMGELY